MTEWPRDRKRAVNTDDDINARNFGSDATPRGPEAGNAVSRRPPLAQSMQMPTQLASFHPSQLPACSPSSPAFPIDQQASSFIIQNSEQVVLQRQNLLKGQHANRTGQQAPCSLPTVVGIAPFSHSAPTSLQWLPSQFGCPHPFQQLCKCLQPLPVTATSEQHDFAKGVQKEYEAENLPKRQHANYTGQQAPCSLHTVVGIAPFSHSAPTSSQWLPETSLVLDNIDVMVQPAEDAAQRVQVQHSQNQSQLDFLRSQRADLERTIEQSQLHMLRRQHAELERAIASLENSSRPDAVSRLTGM